MTEVTTLALGVALMRSAARRFDPQSMRTWSVGHSSQAVCMKL